LFIADTSLITDEEIKEIHDEIKSLSNNVKYIENNDIQLSNIVFTKEELDLLNGFFVKLFGKYNKDIQQINFRNFNRIGSVNINKQSFNFYNVQKIKYPNEFIEMFLIDWLNEIYNKLKDNKKSTFNIEKLMNVLNVDLQK
jgi:hypothetical protein